MCATQSMCNLKSQNDCCTFAFATQTLVRPSRHEKLKKKKKENESKHTSRTSWNLSFIIFYNAQRRCLWPMDDGCPTPMSATDTTFNIDDDNNYNNDDHTELGTSVCVDPDIDRVCIIFIFIVSNRLAAGRAMHSHSYKRRDDDHKLGIGIFGWALRFTCAEL